MTKVTQLPVATTITNYGVFVIVDGGTTKQISWQTLKSGGFKGETGPQGPIGNTGTQGIQGPVGPTGTSATILLGTVISSTVTSSVTNVGTDSTAIFNFVLKQGPQGIQGLQGPIGNTGTQGIQGIQGPIGNTGTLADLQIGAITTGSSAMVGISTSNTITTVFSTSTTAATTVSSTLTTITLSTSSSISTSTLTANIVTLITTSTTISTSSLTATVVTTVSTASTTYGTFLNFVFPPTGIPALPTATSSTVGVVQIGSGINLSANGTISVSPSNVIFTGGTVNNSTTFTNNLTVNGTFTAATLLVGSNGPGTVQSTSDLSLKAAGVITANVPFVLPSYYSTTTLAALIGIPIGAMVFVTDAPGGGQPCYFNGVHWYTINGKLQVL